MVWFIRFIILVSLLINFLPLHSQPSYFIIDTTKVITKEASHQCFPQVVFDGENYIVTWADGRRNLSSSSQSSWYMVNNSIYAGRISPQGLILDSLGVCVDEEEIDSIYYEISCASSSNNSLIVGMYTPSVDFYGIKAIRVGRDIGILDSIPFVYSTGRQPSYPKVTFGAGNYLIVFSFGMLCGLRISEQGVVIDTQPIPIIMSARYNFQLDSDGENYLLVYPDSIALRGIMINNELQVTDTISIIHWNEVDQVPHFGVTYGGGNYFVSYAHYQYIYGVRIRSDGIVIDTIPILIDTLPNASYSRCAYGDSIYLVIVEFEGNLYCKRISLDGQILDPNLIPINDIPSADDPNVTFGGGNFIVVWQDYILGDIDIRYTIITPEGRILNPEGIILSTATQTQEEPAVAFDGTNYLAVWKDYQNYDSTRTDIYGVLLNAEGTILDPGIFAICKYHNSQSQPVICFGGSNYFVVWKDGRAGSGSDIYGTRITPEGRILDSLGLPIHSASQDDEYPAVAFDGENYLVACQVEWPETRIYGARVSIEGMLIDTTAFLISETSWVRIDHDLPSVAFNGINYLVTWQRSHQGDEEIWGAIVETSGLVHDNFRISEENLLLPSRPPSIITNGDDFLVAWDNYLIIYSNRISNEGLVLDTPSVNLGYGSIPSLDFDGTNYILLRKQDYRDYKKLNVCLINQEGEPLDTSGIDIVEMQSSIRKIGIAKGSVNQCLTLYGTYSPEPYNTQRIHGIFFNTTDIKESIQLSMEPVSFSIFPTITKKSLTMKISQTKKEAIKIKIYDISGRVIGNTSYNLNNLVIGSYQFKIDLSTLSNGVYFLKTEPYNIIKKFVIAN